MNKQRVDISTLFLIFFRELKKRNSAMKKNKSEVAVTQSNILIESRYRLLLSETKLFLWMLKEVQPSDKDFKTYRIYMKDFIDGTEAKNTAIYSRAKAITKRFLSKVLELEEGNLQVHFMSMVRYYPREAYIDFRFDPALKPHLIQLQKQFTTYDVSNVINCKYSHSIRIYQLLKSFEGLKRRIVLVKDLRHMLMLESEYEQWHDFKRFVLDRAMKDFKKHSDIYFEYTTKKRGRSVYLITFTIHKQRQQRLFDQPPSPTLADAKPLVDYQRDASEKVKELQASFDKGIPFSEFKKDSTPPPAP